MDRLVPPFEWRHRERGFAGLARLIVDQQVSTIAAEAMWARLSEGLGGVTPQSVLGASPEQLRALWMSAPKARYLLALADAVLAGGLDFDQLGELDDGAAITLLVAQKGVGPWTAEAYLMFCEGRLDVFPGGDIALQEAIRWLDRLQARPGQREAYARAEHWRPYRAVAAHLLWSCYGLVRSGELAPLV